MLFSICNKSWALSCPGVALSAMLLSAASAQNLNCDPCIEREAYKIRAILHGDYSEDFSRQVQSAAEQSGRDMGVNFGIEFHSDDVSMANSIENAIGSNLDALIVSIPSNIVQNSVEEAISNGIPIFGVNARDQIAKESGILDFVGMDQVEGGREAAKELLKIRNNDIGNALFINNKKGYLPFGERKDGFLSELSIGGASVQELDTSTDSIAAALEGCSYDAVLVASEEILDDVIEAYSCDQDIQPLATFGTSKNVFDAIAQGKLAFSISEQSFLQGALPVLMASIYASTGKKIVPPNTQGHIYKAGPRIINLGNLPSNTLQTRENEGFPICSQDIDTNGCTDRSKIKIGGVLHGMTTDIFWDPVFAASEQAAKDMGVELLLDRFESMDDQILLHQKMAAKMESLCKQDIDGLFVTIPSREVVDALKVCQDLNIPVISINTGIEVSTELGLVHHVGMLEYDAGVGAGERLVNSGMRRGLCLDHQPGNTAFIDRCNGFEEAINRANAGGANIEYIGKVDVPLDNEAQYMAVVESAINEEGEWDGVGLFLLGPVQVEEALRVQERHTKVIMGSVDTSETMYDAIDDGNILFGIQQGPFMQGYMPVPLLTWLSYTKQSLTNGVIQSGPSFVESSPSEALQTCEAKLFSVCETNKPYHAAGTVSEGTSSSINTTALIASLVAIFGVMFVAIAYLAIRIKKVNDHIDQMKQQGNNVRDLSFSQKMTSAFKPVSKVANLA